MKNTKTLKSNGNAPASHRNTASETKEDPAELGRLKAQLIRQTEELKVLVQGVEHSTHLINDMLMAMKKTEDELDEVKRYPRKDDGLGLVGIDVGQDYIGFRIALRHFVHSIIEMRLKLNPDCEIYFNHDLLDCEYSFIQKHAQSVLCA